jgi:hypothetical protein
MSKSKPKYPVHGFRLPTEIVREFEEVAKLRGYTRQQAMILMMQSWIDKD